MLSKNENYARRSQVREQLNGVYKYRFDVTKLQKKASSRLKFELFDCMLLISNKTISASQIVFFFKSSTLMLTKLWVAKIFVSVHSEWNNKLF